MTPDTRPFQLEKIVMFAFFLDDQILELYARYGPTYNAGVRNHRLRVYTMHVRISKKNVVPL